MSDSETLGGGEPRKTLIGLSREELAAELAPLGIAGFRARQLWHWIYDRGETDRSPR